MDFWLKINIFGQRASDDARLIPIENQSATAMKQAEKQFYQTPAVQVIGVEQGYAVCTSGGTEPFTDGGNYGDNLFN